MIPILSCSIITFSLNKFADFKIGKGGRILYVTIVICHSFEQSVSLTLSIAVLYLSLSFDTLLQWNLKSKRLLCPNPLKLPPPH